MKTCPADTLDCGETGRRTTVTWTLDGAPFNGITLFVNVHSTSVMLLSSDYHVTSYGPIAAVQGASALQLVEGEGASVNAVSYYDDPPRWGGVTELKFVSLPLRSARGSAWFFRHASFDFGMSEDELSAMIGRVYEQVSALTHRTPPEYRAFFMPSEMVGGNGDGNFAFWPDTVTVNYGNPDWLSYIGGFQTSVQWEWSHELTHLLVAPLSERLSNITCLNEGLADAVGNDLGYIPESDFRPSDATVESNCRAITDVHGRGNCYLWHLKHYRSTELAEGPLWNANTFGGLFATPRPLPLDTCSMPDPDQSAPDADDLITGDSWVVYFSDATGEDMTEFVQSLGFFTSGTLEASLEALKL